MTAEVRDEHTERAIEVAVDYERRAEVLDRDAFVDTVAQAIADAEERGAQRAVGELPAVTIVVAEPPGPTSQFVEVENDAGRGVRVGEWSTAANGFGRLRITGADLQGMTR